MAYPEKIHAIGILETGDFDVIRDLEVAFPQPAPDQILLKVEYAGVNFVDTYFRSGAFSPSKFPVLLGTEAAGEIVALPTDQKVLEDAEYKKRDFKVGDKVAVNSMPSFARHIASKWTDVAPLPEGVSTRVAAAALLQGLTALSFVTEAYPIKQGDTVLVHTAAGGLGLLFTQLAKARGATVIGTTSTQEKADKARAAGADHVILYKNEDTVKRVLEITNNEGVNAVFDGVGKDTFEGNFQLLARGGTFVSVGSASGPIPPFDLRKLAPKNLRICRPRMDIYLSRPEDSGRYYKELFDLVAQKSLEFEIFKEYPFSAEGAIQAQKDLVGGRTFGKLLLKV